MRIEVNGAPREVPAGITVAALVELVAPDHGERGVAVALDAEVVRRADWPARRLEGGARVEVLQAVQGG